MSFIFEHNGILFSFTEFLSLRESVESKETPFGTNKNFDNKKWIHTGKLVSTFFHHDSNRRVVVHLNLESDEVGFGVLVGDIHSINFVDYSSERTHLNDALKVFNKVLFVIILGAGTFDMKLLKFFGADPKLGVMYDTICKNKFFLNKLKLLGFNYLGKNDENFHIFEHI